MNGEYALEVYVNDPARDGNTYTHVCQYLLVRPEKGDNRDALFYQTPQYNDCYNLYGLQEPLQPISMSLEQLARGESCLLDAITFQPSHRLDSCKSFLVGICSLGIQDSRISDQMAAEPRPAAKHAAMHGVEVEQITVPSPKPKPGTAPKPGAKGMS